MKSNEAKNQEQSRLGAALAAELSAAQLIPSLASGVIIGLFEIILAISFAALIFSGGLSEYVANGIGLALLGAAVSTAITAVFTSVPGTISGNQDAPAAIMAVIAAAIAGSVAGNSSGAGAFATVAIAIAVSTLLTGASLFILGTFELGNLVRFLPYPVIGGFLAGTGWLLVTGAVSLMAGVTPTLSQLGPLFEAGAVSHWLPGLFFALLLLAVLSRANHALIMPGMILGSLLLFYLVAWSAGSSLEELRNQGWLFEAFSSESLWPPLPWGEMGQVEWPAIAAQLPNIATLVLLSAVALLLNASGLEVAVKRDVSLNRELRSAGIANLFTGAVGGLVGYQQLSLSILRIRAGQGGRLTGLIAAALCLLVLFAGASIVSLFPKVVAGGLLLYLGLDLLKDWVLTARSRLPFIEYAIVIFILIVIAGVGFLEGVAVGVAAAILLFAVAYSRIDVVRNELTGRHVSSRVTRHPKLQRRLQEEEERFYILKLQGFIFFGTADKLLNQIQERLEDPDRPRPRFVILDFKRVTGLDSTAMASLIKVGTRIEDKGAEMALSSTTEGLRNQLVRGGLPPGDTVHYFDSLDGAVEQCEGALLDEMGEADEGVGLSLLEQLAAMVPDRHGLEELSTFLRRQELAPGEYLMRLGEAPDRLYFLESGQITALLEYPDRPDVRLESMTGGNVVGEIGFYLNHARTASVKADVSSVVYALAREELERMEREAPRAASTLHRIIAQLQSQRVTQLVSTVNVLEQ